MPTTKSTATESHRVADRIEARLDDLEERLPTVPAKWLELNRQLASNAIERDRRNRQLFVDAVEVVAKTLDSGVRTVVGTARWSIERTLDVARTGVRRTAGQATAQAERAVDAATDEVTDLADGAIARAESRGQAATKRHLRAQTKAELYEQAQDLDVEGRADMNKSQLVDALSAAS